MRKESYDALAMQQRLLPQPGDGDPLVALVQAATLAASSHNTQPWQFHIALDEISITPDFDRQCPIVDPDNSHLFKSLGCAAENIVAAAPAYGLAASISLESTGRLVIALAKTDPSSDKTVLQAIATRQCTKLPYDCKALSAQESAALEEAGKVDGVRVLLITDNAKMEAVLGYINEGNRSQLSDQAFRHELIEWIRFNDEAAIALGDGLASRPSGQPQLPGWLAKPLMKFVLTPGSQVAKDTENLKSSAGIAAFIGSADDIPVWVNIGRAYERFALAATQLGIRNAFINQPIEVRQLRQKLHTTLGLKQNEIVHLMVRYGHGPLAPYSLRRPPEDVSIFAAGSQLPS